MMIPYNKIVLLYPILCAAATAAAGIPSEYILTDITGWSTSQLASLPHFDRYVPVAPAGTTGDFVPVAHNGQGLTAGNRTFSTTWVQGSGAYVKGASQTDISAWLWAGYSYSYSWSWTYYDGQDYHFQNGFVTHSPVQDMNSVGQAVGYATRPGSGSGAGSSLGYTDHAWILDTETGLKTDITPDATRAQANSINDHGDVAGYWSNSNGYHAFRRTADGTFTDFVVTNGTVVPSVINNHGHVAGMVTIYSVPRLYYPFFSESGSTMIALPLPSQNSPDTSSIADLNEHDVMVGEAHKSDAPQETSATRWTRTGGTWQTEDLNELLQDNLDFILDRCVAVNDAGYILATGHLDGGPDNTYNTHRLLLTPDVFAPPSACSLPARDIGSTSVLVRAVVDAAGLSSGWRFDYGTATVSETSTAWVSATGTVPNVEEQTLTGLQPHTTYRIRVTATNIEGVAYGSNVTFTTLWDWPSWSMAHLGTTDPDGDHNTNGAPDLLDYATDSQPDLLPAWNEEHGSHMVFHHALEVDGVTLAIDVSSNLLSWVEGPLLQSTSVDPSNEVAIILDQTPESETREQIRITPAGTNQTDFLRLRAVLN